MGTLVRNTILGTSVSSTSVPHFIAQVTVNGGPQGPITGKQVVDHWQPGGPMTVARPASRWSHDRGRRHTPPAYSFYDVSTRIIRRRGRRPAQVRGDRTLDRVQVHAGSIGGSGRLRWREELGECFSERLGMGQGGGVRGTRDLTYPCVGDVVHHVPRAGDEEGLGD